MLAVAYTRRVWTLGDREQKQNDGLSVETWMGISSYPLSNDAVGHPIRLNLFVARMSCMTCMMLSLMMFISEGLKLFSR